MSTKIAVYIGIGRLNKGSIHAHGSPYSLEEEVGTVCGSGGTETMKICNSVVELGELPDIDALVEKRREELKQAEKDRHAERMAELDKIRAA